MCSLSKWPVKIHFMLQRAVKNRVASQYPSVIDDTDQKSPGGILVKNMYHISAASIDIDPNRGYCKFLSHTLIVDIRDQKWPYSW